MKNEKKLTGYRHTNVVSARWTSYAYNNPINYTDPSGHMPTDGCSTEGCGLSSAELYSYRRVPWDQLTQQEQEVLIKAIGGDAQEAQKTWTIERSGGNAVNVAGKIPEDPAADVLVVYGGLKIGWTLLKELGSSAVAACAASEPCRDKIEDAGQLIKELGQSGVKFSPENLVRVTKLANGQIVFLEEGNVGSGLQHILEGHAADFVNRGIEAGQIPNALFTALTEGTVIGTQGGASIYQFTFSGQLQNVAIVIGSNGYIVTAYPVTP